jgi:N-acetylglutamate synthase-like GNAT family acetyltransferase
MPNPAPHDALDHCNVRTYRPEDHPAVLDLYDHGLLTGHLDPYDTAADMENIAEAFFSDPRDHFWVAEIQGQVLGMVGVVHEERDVAEVRRLRVHKDWQNTPMAERLIEMALAHCRKHAYLKVVLDTRFEQSAAMDLFTRFGFQHTRTKSLHGKELPEFYLDIYRGKKEEK